jgi:dUTP pyrophosphatase
MYLANKKLSTKMSIKVNIKRIKDNIILPTKATYGSAGFDIYIPMDIKIEPMHASIIDLGFAIQIPHGYYGMLCVRSSIGIKHGATLRNTIGIIDSDYRGEVKACLQNNNPVMPIDFAAGDRIAQFIICPVPDIELIESNDLASTERGQGGIGSTGS